MIALLALLVVGALTSLSEAFDLTTASTVMITHSGDLGRNWTCGGPATTPEETLVIERGALQLDLEVSLEATLTLQLAGVLNSFKLKVGTDADGDKVIESNEWVTVEVGEIEVSGGVTTATIGPVDVGIDGDVYRFEQSRSDEGTVWEEWLPNSEYTTEDWDE